MKDALLVFVEGGADACFVLRSLGQLAGAVYLDKMRPAQLPTPFGAPREPGRAVQPDTGLILKWHDRDSMERTLAESAEGHEPVFQFAARVPEPEMLVLIVRMGGDYKYPVVNELLSRLSLAMSPELRGNLDINRAAVAFIFDADTPGHYPEGVGDCLKLRATYFEKNYSSWLAGPGPQHGEWKETREGSFRGGLYVLHDSADSETHSGTLESLLEPRLKVYPRWKKRIGAAKRYLRRHWELTDPVKEKAADRAKARLTMAGQFTKAGESLAQILKGAKKGTEPCVPHEVFKGSESEALVKFLLDAYRT